MVGRMLPEANWSHTITPTIYLPGISKQDLKNVTAAGLDIQPLIEYQYTGVIWTQDNGKEWTIQAFLQNKEVGMGLAVSQDNATKEALKKSLPDIFDKEDVLYGRPVIDANYLNTLVFPDIVPSILKWMSVGDAFTKSLSPDKKEAFASICKTSYGFEPDFRNIRDVVEKFGSRRNGWDSVWKYYSNAPRKYPEIAELLTTYKPDDLGTGVFALPDESWPPVNEERENELRKSLSALGKKNAAEALSKLKELEARNRERRTWVWTELGQAPLVLALEHLISMAVVCTSPFPSDSAGTMVEYYKASGYKADQSMRKAYASVKTAKDKEVIRGIVTVVYKPWLETLTQKFQDLIIDHATLAPVNCIDEVKDTYILFVDAFRYELAMEFLETLQKTTYKVELETTWTALPSLTPTAKPQSSPMAGLVSRESNFNEFRPQLQSGKDLQISAFREALKTNGYNAISSAGDFTSGEKGWFEIGDIDSKGHAEQAEVVKRVYELFDMIREVIDAAFEAGLKRVRIVTDHGWLLLPGGLPKTELPKDLTETRWGRCALIKEGAKTKLKMVPWHWNPAVFIAYAPGISFFKKNEEYAHGGLSLHECLIPVITIESTFVTNKTARIAQIKWTNLVCKIELADAPDNYLVDIRTKYSDPSTSIVISEGKKVKDGRCTLMVDDEAEGQSAVVVVMTSDEIIHDKKPTLVGH
jgi:hypothetical protein